MKYFYIVICIQQYLLVKGEELLTKCEVYEVQKSW